MNASWSLPSRDKLYPYEFKNIYATNNETDTVLSIWHIENFL